ncbi:MAG: OsmC family protein [Gemmatimonadaceae bacterium]
MTGQPIVVVHDRGARFAAQIRSHTVHVDQPLQGGGDDSAPTPLELLAASLGSCIALYVRKFLVARDLVTEGLRIEVSQEIAQRPHRVSRFVIQVILPDDTPAVYRPMLEAVARVCPAHNTIAHGAEMQIAIALPVAP